MQYNAIQCNTMQYNAIQCNTMQYNAIQCNTMQYNAIQYNTIMKQYYTILMQYNICSRIQCKLHKGTLANVKQKRPKEKHPSNP